MREIIYIQAGNTSNHIGTHFWNTQESYFTYDDNKNIAVNHDISFREGLSNQKEPTFCPRLLVFDHKQNFGTLSKYNALYSDSNELDTNDIPSERLWPGTVSEHRQDSIPKSEYQERMEKESYDEEDSETDDFTLSDARFWSDFNRVFYIPRSIQSLSDIPEWEASKGDWNYGKSVFDRYNSENSLSDGDLRLFIEECDNLQGFQVQFDNTTFGAFTVALFENIRDELPKAPLLSLPIMSSDRRNLPDIENIPARKRALLDAICLRSLNDLATQAIPLHSPSLWQLGNWSKHIDINTNNLYQTSAILSAQIESATLPLRLKHTVLDVADLCQQLNWTQNTRFSNLTGVYPLVDGDELDELVYDYSTLLERTPTDFQKGDRLLAQRNITRGLNVRQVFKSEGYFSKSGLESPYLSNIHTVPYPLPSSYPRLLVPLQDSRPTKRARQDPAFLPSPKSISLISSLSTTTASAVTFKAHAKFVDECVRKKITDIGMELDDFREIANDLWTIHDAYVKEDEESDDIGLDEDEEVQ